MNPFEISAIGAVPDSAELVDQIKRRVASFFAHHCTEFRLDEQAFFKENPVDPQNYQDAEIMRLRRSSLGPEQDERVSWSLHSLQRPTPARDLPQALSRVAIAVPILHPPKKDIHSEASQLISALGYTPGPAFRRKGVVFSRDTATISIFQVYGQTDTPLKTTWLIEAVNCVSLPSAQQSQPGTPASQSSKTSGEVMAAGIRVIEEIKHHLKGLFWRVYLDTCIIDLRPPSPRMTSRLISAREQNANVASLFTRKEVIGKGAYGAVYKSVHNATGTVVAIKVIELDTADEDITEIQREVAVLSQLRDAERNNCTLYHGCWLYKTQLWLAMDHAAGGSIRTIMKSGPLEEKFISIVMRESLVALAYLHRQGIIHRDIKAANILLTATGRIIVCDFGVAAHLQGQNKRATFIGTPYWMAPEVILDGKLYDTRADIWSLGVTCFECATGNPPFVHYEPLRAIQLIPKNPPAKLDPNQPWTPFMREFLAFCLTEDPNERMTAEDLLKTKWIKANAKLPVTLLRELINRYRGWVNQGGIRQSIIDVNDSPSGGGDDAYDMTDESNWDYSPLPADAARVSYTGSGLDSLSASQNGLGNSMSRKNPLAHLFADEEDDSAAAVTATAAAKAYGLGLSTSTASGTVRTQSRPQISKISIPNLGDGSDDEGITQTVKLSRNKPRAQPPDALTLRAPAANVTLSPPSPRSGSPPPPRRRPSTPPPPSPSLNTPNDFRFGSGPAPIPKENDPPTSSPAPLPATSNSMPTPHKGSPPHFLARSRSNTLSQPDSAPQFSNGPMTSSPPAARSLIRRGRSGTTSSDAVPPLPTHIRKISTTVHPLPISPASVSPLEKSLSLPLPVTEGTLLAAWQDGSPIKALDYASMVSSSDVHSGLERTVQDLGEWLQVVDNGLSALLAFVPSNAP